MGGARFNEAYSELEVEKMPHLEGLMDKPLEDRKEEIRSRIL